MKVYIYICGCASESDDSSGGINDNRDVIQIHKYFKSITSVYDSCYLVIKTYFFYHSLDTKTIFKDSQLHNFLQAFYYTITKLFLHVFL